MGRMPASVEAGLKKATSASISLWRKPSGYALIFQLPPALRVTDLAYSRNTKGHLFCHPSISPAALCLVKGAVGIREPAGEVAVFFDHGQPETCSDRTRRHREMLDFASEALGAASRFKKGGRGQEDRKLFAPQTAEQVAWTKRPHANIGNGLQNFIARVMSKPIVNALEVVEVHSKQCCRRHVPVVLGNCLRARAGYGPSGQRSCQKVFVGEGAKFELLDDQSRKLLKYCNLRGVKRARLSIDRA